MLKPDFALAPRPLASLGAAVITYEVKWLATPVVVAMHAELIAEHGGPPEIRDAGLLESALARPRHRASYARPPIFELAATYGWGISRNHPFADGNQCVALMACYALLRA